jgi:hypothetical protein
VLEDLAEVLFDGGAQIISGNNGVVVHQQDQSNAGIGSPGHSEGGGRKLILSRVKLIELAIERLNAQAQEIKEIKRHRILE